MKVTDLKDKAPVDEITLTVTAKEEPRDVRGGSLRVCNVTGKDDTGTVIVTLWNNDIEKVHEGDTIRITTGWSAVYNNVMQVSSGKFGKLEIVGAKDSGSDSDAEEE